MKKTISILTLLVLGISAMGAEAELSQLTLSISTQGPDYYADNTAVQVGEKYLLVYVGKEKTFAGLNSDGTLVDTTDNKIVTEAVAVKGAKCGFKAIQYPPTLYPAGGTFIIVLLDTRDAGGAVGGLVAQIGTSEAEGAAAGSSTALNSISVPATNGDDPAMIASVTAKAPAGTPAPVITSVKGAGESVELKVGNMSAAAVYEVQSKTDLSSGSWEPVSGATRLQLTAQSVGAEVPAILQVPQNDKVRFFRVVVNGSN